VGRPAEAHGLRLTLPPNFSSAIVEWHSQATGSLPVASFFGDR